MIKSVSPGSRGTLSSSFPFVHSAERMQTSQGGWSHHQNIFFHYHNQTQQYPQSSSYYTADPPASYAGGYRGSTSYESSDWRQVNLSCYEEEQPPTSEGCSSESQTFTYGPGFGARQYPGLYPYQEHPPISNTGYEPVYGRTGAESHSPRGCQDAHIRPVKISGSSHYTSSSSSQLAPFPSAAPAFQGRTISLPSVSPFPRVNTIPRLSQERRLIYDVPDLRGPIPVRPLTITVADLLSRLTPTPTPSPPPAAQRKRRSDSLSLPSSQTNVPLPDSSTFIENPFPTSSRSKKHQCTSCDKRSVGYPVLRRVN